MLGGELTHHFGNSAILTALVAMFVLWRYRVAVLRGMMRGDGAVLPLPAPASRPAPAAASSVAARLAWERRAQARIALAYLLTTLICGVPLALGYMMLSDMDVAPAQLMLFAFIYAFAAAPMIAVTLALPPLRALFGVLLLTALLTALAVGGALLQRLLSGRPVGLQHLALVPLFLQLAINTLWMPLLFWLFTWPKRLRGVAPVTFAALLVFGLAPFAGVRLTAALAATEAGTPLVLQLGLNGMFVLIALPAGWLAWKRLHALARAFEAKRFSDVQLMSRTWWLMLVASVGLELISVRPQLWLPLAVCAGVVVLFAPVNRWLLAHAGVAAGRGPARTLLLLRTFGYTARTERLFDRVGARWRLFGPVTMIAAPDVAARTIDAGDYLRWLTGRVDEMFVTSRADLDAKLAALDLAADPDGLFRVNEFCCRDNTWQATVVELMQRADAVVMDVRGITAARHGCEFELQQLAGRMAPQRVVLVTDAATDTAVLRAALGAAFEQVRVIEWRRARDGRAVFEALLDAAA